MANLDRDFAEGTHSVLARSITAEIRARMAAQRISGKALAEQIGVSQNYFATRLRDEKPFTLDDLDRIVQVIAGEADPHVFIQQAHERQGEAVGNLSLDEFMLAAKEPPARWREETDQ